MILLGKRQRAYRWCPACQLVGLLLVSVVGGDISRGLHSRSFSYPHYVLWLSLLLLLFFLHKTCCWLLYRPRLPNLLRTKYHISRDLARCMRYSAKLDQRASVTDLRVFRRSKSAGKMKVPVKPNSDQWSMRLFQFWVLNKFFRPRGLSARDQVLRCKEEA